MKCISALGVVLAISASSLLSCSTSDTVVAANVQSSNDNQYNPVTNNGQKGGLLDPGIVDGILNLASPNPTVVRIAVKVRLTVSQNGQTPVEHITVPAVNSWTVDKLDADGNPVKDDMGATVKETRKGIGAYFERITVPDGWHEGSATLQAEALDSAGVTVLSATTPFTMVDKGVVYVPVDLKLPDPPGLDGGAGDAGDAGDGSASDGSASDGPPDAGASEAGANDGAVSGATDAEEAG